MPITPLDINVSVNKLPEVLRAQQENANKSFINSSNGEMQANKETQHERESVSSAQKDHELKNDSKSSSKHHGENKKKKKKHSEENADETVETKKEHFIDIRI